MNSLRLLTLMALLGSCSLSYSEEATLPSYQNTLATHWAAAFDALTERDIITLTTSYLKNPASESRKPLIFNRVTKVQAVGTLLIITHQPTSSRPAYAETVVPADKVVSVTGSDTRTHSEIRMDRLKEEKEEARQRERTNRTR
jgi:hypothetical protein